MPRNSSTPFLPYLKKGSIVAVILIALTACGPEGEQSGYGADDSSGYGSDGMAAATSWAEPTPSIYADVENESDLLSNTRQLVTDSLRSGEGYFSADGRELIYQSEQAGDNPFYQIFVLDLASGVSRLVSPGVGLTTCAWIHPTQDLVMYSSTHEDPNAQAKQAEEIAIRESGIERAYGWDYDRHYDIYIANSDGSAHEISLTPRVTMPKVHTLPMALKFCSRRIVKPIRAH